VWGGLEYLTAAMIPPCAVVIGLAVAVASAATASPAAAPPPTSRSATALIGPQGDWFASLYTGDGVELRSDERVFALFAVLNAVGFDQGLVARALPVARIAYHPVRLGLRARVLSSAPEVRRAADAFLDAHPLELRRYLTWAIRAAAPPLFGAGAGGPEAQELKGFEQVLAHAWRAWRLDELYAASQREHRRELKAYLPVIDAPLARARALLGAPPTQELQLWVNLLDAQGVVRGAWGEGGEAVLVVGPADRPNVEGVIREYARISLEPAVVARIGKWRGGATVLQDARLAGVTDRTVQEYAVSLFSLAVTLQAVEAPDAVWEAEAARGYWGLREIARLVDGRPVETWMPDALARVEARRPPRK
jgi:hypothetical protein